MRREKFIPRIPLLARFQILVSRDISDVEPPPEQFNFGLRLMIPIATLPGPRIAIRRLLWHYQDAPALSFHRGIDPIPFVFLRLGRADYQRLLIHHKIITIKPMPQGLLAHESRRHFYGLYHLRTQRHHRQKYRNKEQRRKAVQKRTNWSSHKLFGTSNRLMKRNHHRHPRKRGYFNVYTLQGGR